MHYSSYSRLLETFCEQSFWRSTWVLQWSTHFSFLWVSHRTEVDERTSILKRDSFRDVTDCCRVDTLRYPEETTVKTDVHRSMKSQFLHLIPLLYAICRHVSCRGVASSSWILARTFHWNVYTDLNSLISNFSNLDSYTRTSVSLSINVEYFSSLQLEKAASVFVFRLQLSCLCRIP
jgi:hypothetical protein